MNKGWIVFLVGGVAGGLVSRYCTLGLLMSGDLVFKVLTFPGVILWKYTSPRPRDYLLGYTIITGFILYGGLSVGVWLAARKLRGLTIKIPDHPNPAP